MKLVVKNKFFSLGGASKVLDENKQDYLKVKGKFFTFTKKKFVKDLEGNTLFIVRNKFWTWFMPKALIYDKDKKLIATVKRRFKLKQSYEIEGADEPISIESQKLVDFTMTIRMGEKVIGTISWPFFRINDTFNLEFEDPEDASFLVAVVIAIDNIRDKQTADND